MSASPGERETRLEALLSECRHTFNQLRNQPTTLISGERIHTYGLAVRIEQALDARRTSNMQVHIWQGPGIEGWVYAGAGARIRTAAGFLSYEAALADYQNRYGAVHDLNCAPPEKSSVSASETVERSTVQTVEDSAPAPFQSDHSTIPRSFLTLDVAPDLLPLLKETVEREIDRVENRLENVDGWAEYETRALRQAHSNHLNDLRYLQAQIAAN